MQRETAVERGPLWPYLALWTAPALLDAYLAFGMTPRPATWQFAFEVLFLAAAGRTQWRLARGWARSALLPALVLGVFTLSLYAPSARHQMVPYVIGLVGSALGIARLVGRRWTVPIWLGTALALAVVVGARTIDTSFSSTPRPDGNPAPSLGRQLLWPLHDRGRARVGTTADGPPIVVISVDTLRADAAATMRSVQRLAARGATWPRAMSTSSWTLPALASLQTGLMPSAHGATCLEGGHCQGLASGVRTLAQDLADAGWTTAAIVSNPWASEATGFDRGFTTFEGAGQSLNRLLVAGPPVGAHRQDDGRTVDAALAWLADAPARGTYLWVHLMGPHMPYLHADDESLQVLDAKALRSSYPLSIEQQRRIRVGYDGEVAYTDTQVQRLLDFLETRGVLDDGVVVFTSDHGEEFWEHGGIEHGHSHHGEVTDVPLVLIAPGVEPGERTGVASLLDVAPTLRGIAGIMTDGVDLRRGVPPERTATAWGGIILHLDCSARSPGRRVIARDCGREPHLSKAYDLVRDPRELTPLAADPTDPVTQAAWAVRAPAQGAAAALPTERLRALGYLQE